MKKWIALVLLGGLMPPLSSSAIDLKQSKFTQVVNSVEIISANKTLQAAVNEVFSMPDVLRTGPDSRAELEATDGTITRVGANTIFSFDPASRTIKLDQGSLLFHSPHGKGGGTIQTGSATASVIGTTIIVTCTPNGGFKLLDLEGQAEVRYLDGLTQTLEPGQLTFILSGGSPSPVIVFRLDTETKGSALVSGFNAPLDSQSKINSEITQQLLQILNGTAADTGYVVGNNATVNSVQVIVDNINNTPSPSTPPSTTQLPTVFLTDGSVIGNDRVSTLPVDYTPLDPAHTFDSSITPFTPADIEGINSIDSFYQGLLFLGLASPASGFFGNNIDMDTANVDLSSFAGKSDFDIMAAKNLNVWQSVTFTGSPVPTAYLESELPDVVSLIAGEQMLIASGLTLEADTTTFGLVADSFGTLDPSTGLADSDYPNALEGVSLVNNDGAIQILSLSDFTLENGSTITAGNDGAGLGLEIESEGDLTLGNNDYSLLEGPEWDVTVEAGGDVDLVASDDIGIFDSDVYSDYGNVNITAAGAVNINDSDVYGGYYSESGGAVGITGMSVSVLDYSDIYAYDDVNITSQGASPDGDAVDIEDSDIYAGYNEYSEDGDYSTDGGSVNITANNGDAYLYDNDIEAYNGAISDGDVNIYASGTADIEDTYIEAGGDVNIESGGTLYLGWFDDGYEIYADGTVNLTSDNGDVDIDDYEIYAYGSDENGNGINISAGGNVDIEDSSEIYAYGGGISIIADGSVYLYDDDIEAGEDTEGLYDLDVTSASSTVDVDDTYLYADGGVSLESGGTLTVEDDSEIEAGSGDASLTSDNSDVDIYDSEVYSDYGGINISAFGNVDMSDNDIESGYYDGGGDINITAGGSLSDFDSDIYAYGGDLNIESGGGMDIEEDDLYADGDVNIESGGTLYLGWNDYGYSIEAGGTVNLKSDNGDLDAYDYNIYSDNGDVNITAVNGAMDIDYNWIYADYGNVNIESYGALTLEDDTEIYAYDDVNINSTGPVSEGDAVDIEDSYIYAGYNVSYAEAPNSPDGGSVNITANNGDAYLYDDDIEAYSGAISDGDVNIYASGTADIEDTYISAVGDVNIESGGNLYLGWNEDGDDLEAYGTVNLTSDNADVDIYDNEIYAYGSDENGNGINISAGGNVDMEDSSEIYAYNGGVNISGAGGVYLYDDDIEAGYDSETGDMSITSAGGTVDIDDTYLYAAGDVTIESGGTLTVEDDSEIEAGSGDASLTSDNSDVDIYDSDVYSDYGNVNITAAGAVNINDSDVYGGYYSESGGAVGITGMSVSVLDYSDIYAYDDVNITSQGASPDGDAVDIEDSDIYAGYNEYSEDGDYSTDGGSVNITANNGDAYLYDDDIEAYNGAISDGDVNIYASGTADIEDTYIEAGGDVNIESGGTLTLNNSEPYGGGYGYNEVYADNGSVSLQSDYADVDINGYNIYAYNGDINISAGDSVDIENAYFEVSGDANVTATGNIYVDDSDFDMDDDGDINVNAGGNIDVLYTDGSGSGSINLTAGGYVNVYDYSLDISSFYVTAGTYADFGADQFADIYDSSITANGGGVDITGNSAGVDIDATSITVTGDIDVTAGGGYYEETPYISRRAAPSFVAPTFVAPLEAGAEFVTLGTFTPETFVLPSPISASSDNIVENGANIEDIGTVDLEANIDANVYNNSSLVSDSGDVMIVSAGTEEADSSYLEANGSVYLVASGSLSLSDSLASSDIYADIYADNGDVDIQSSGGMVDIEDTYISAEGSVNIESSGTLTLGGTGNSINADNGDVSLTSDNADVDAVNYGIYSDYGDVNISAGGNVSLSGDAVYSGYSLGYSGTGNVNIQSLTGTVELEDTYISAGGNIGILSFGTLILGNSSGEEIDAGGWANLSSVTGDADIANYSIYTYGSDIGNNGVTISAAAGSLNLSDDSINAYNSGDVTIAAPGAGGTADLDDTYIFADSDVNIESSSTLTFQNSSEIESYGGNGILLTSVNAGVDVYGSSLYAYNGDVDITAPGASGSIDLEDSYVSASGNVSIESAGTAGDVLLGLTDFEQNDGEYNSANVIEAGGSVSLMSDNKNVVVADYSIGESSPVGGDVTISAPNGTVGLENAYLNANGDVSITAGGTSGSYYPGDVALGLLDYQFDYGYNNNEIDAGGSVLLQSDNADVLVYGYSIYAYGDWDAGDVDIYAYNGQIDLDDSYISAWGDADIESGGTLTVEDYSQIESYGDSGISLTSDNSDVDVYDSSLYAYYGNVNITAVGDSAGVDLENDSISAYGNVNIESDGTLTLGNVEAGGDTIYAATGVYLSSDSGDVDVYNSSISGGFANDDDGFDGTVDDMTIEDGSDLMAGGVANLKAYGAEISIYAAGNVNVYYTDIDPGGGINISDSTIIADGSDINGNGVNIYSDGYFYVGGYSDMLYDDDIEGNNISISGSTITANNGGVSIVNDASFSTLDSVGFDLLGSTVLYGDITISAGSDITANNGSVDIETASSDLSDVYVDEGSSLSVGDISIYDSTIAATGVGGDVTISAGGYLTTGTLEQGDYVKAGDLISGVSISADGDISLYGNDGAYLDYTAAEAGGKFALESSYDVYAYDSSLMADTLDADIYADYGTLDLEYSTVEAPLGGVDIEAGYSDTSGSETLTLVGDTIMAGGTATLTAQGDVDVDQDVSDTTTLTAGGDVDVTSYNGNVDVENSTVTAGGSFTLRAPGSVALNNSSVTAVKNVTVNAGTGITINGVPVTADDATYGSIVLASTTGQTAIQNGSSVTGNLTVNSPDGILIDGSRGGTFSGNIMTLTAGSGDISGGPAITVNNADLSVFQTVNMSAHTVNLSDVAFGGSSDVNLHSYLGLLAPLPDTGAVSLPGYVNFINGVTYGGTLITTLNQAAYVNPVSGTGIHIAGLP